MPARSRALRYTAWTALAVLAFFLLAAADLALRSRSAMKRGDKFYYWLTRPDDKKAYFDGLYKSRAEKITRDAEAGRLSAAETARQTELAAAERDFRLQESSAKQAYIWYRTAAEDFRSPLNPWAAEASAKADSALAAWKEELKRRGVTAEDWMLR
ncbi:MAG: hypothetical protein M0011_08200 [Elusimicrobia bacterium]|nr:hypothetical protein [Elusimicrobiota bacterium]